MNNKKDENTLNSLPINQIINGDNVQIMKTLPDNSIDLIFADPPYNMNLDKDLYRFGGEKFKGVDDEWDKYDNLAHYDNECKTWLKQCLRILKKNGSLWVIGSFQNIHRLGYILQDMNAWIINEIVWEKSNPVPNFAGTRFVNAQETLLWVVKDKKAKFKFNYKTMKHLNGGTQMKSVWKLPICSGSERLKDKDGFKVHNTQKPLELLQRIILACSSYGDIVLDPFSGTGTTAHAAKFYGRKYIGIEQSHKYYLASLNRLNNVIETTQHDDLKFAYYDIAPEKVSFKDLIDKKYINVKDIVKINNLELFFNTDGTLNHNGIKKTPNALCREIFAKPTNAWNILKINGETLGEIRERYRNDLKLNV
ncbi:site-specific DNA-methyltransferase [Mycoplasmopsis phocirhinis]|uniref:Methyltransferase n=1 Tax=Mycoplasmopsis phocirhinis TaxID=142650 RepID=A0A4P6MTX4_9BACT|nr:site-specific DNA-methyltransferase [Mycoplasmopsis phocirhinis]QBF34847.1 site-specific DNA-methyltransferase [Mycoplasmopsis phocirhinis]